MNYMCENYGHTPQGAYCGRCGVKKYWTCRERHKVHVSYRYCPSCGRERRPESE